MCVLLEIRRPRSHSFSNMFVDSFLALYILPEKHLQQQVSRQPSSKTRKRENSQSKLEHSCWQTTVSVPSTNSIKWISQIKSPSTKQWNNKPSPSQRQEFKLRSMREQVSWLLLI